MSYHKFIDQIAEKYGNFFTEIATVFFEKAVMFAKSEKYEEAITIARHAVILTNYSNIGNERVYLLGMLSQAYLDNDDLEMADEFFSIGIRLLDKNDESYENDVDQFLDLKIVIEQEKEKKNMGENPNSNQPIKIPVYDEEFTHEIIDKYGYPISLIIDIFFTKAVKLAESKSYKDAITVGTHALLLSNYNPVRYAVLHIIGFLCQVYLKNGQIEAADEYFNFGMEIINKNDEDYDRDIDSFLDLNILIEKELKKSKL